MRTFVSYLLILGSCRTNLTAEDSLHRAFALLQNSQSGTLPRRASVQSTCNYDYSSATESKILAGGWVKQFEENFDSSPNSPANSNWQVWVGGAFNNELQMFTANPKNMQVIADPGQPKNHVLVIQALKEKVTGPKYRQDVDATPTSFDFTAARIESKRRFKASPGQGQVRMVARIKLPTGYGMWPAFWSYGDNWPTEGEIDILEARGNEPYLFQTNYFYGVEANKNMVHNEEAYLTSSTSLTSCWHVYEVIWSKEALTYLLDGEVVDVKKGSYVSRFYDKPHKLTLNLSVGGDFFYANGSRPSANQIPLSPGEGRMLVDWVKVFYRQ